MGGVLEKEDKQNLPSSNVYVGGEFNRATDNLKIIRSQIPLELATSIGSCEMLVRDGYLPTYQRYVNEMLEMKPAPILAPIVSIDKNQMTGAIRNIGRSERPNKGNPITPGNEKLTPPPLLVIRSVEDHLDDHAAIDGSDWIVRIFVNAFPYALPRREILLSTQNERIETVCGLSLVVVLNPAKKQLYDTHEKNTAMFELLLYALGKATDIITSQGEYQDNTTNEVKKFDAVMSWINDGPNAGGSLSRDDTGQPHAQILALRRDNTMPFYRGDHFDRDGKCERCKGIEEKVSHKDERIVGITRKVLAYVPKHEAKRKGRMIRITPRRANHSRDIPSLIGDIQTLKDTALLLHDSIRAVALAQLKNKVANPSFNVIFAQDPVDDRAHQHIDVMDGEEGGGFAIVGPVYSVLDDQSASNANMLIHAPESRETPEAVAKEFRSLVDFPQEY